MFIKTCHGDGLANRQWEADRRGGGLCDWSVFGQIFEVCTLHFSEFLRALGQRKYLLEVKHKRLIYFINSLAQLFPPFQNNASKLLLAIMESRHDSENAERILYNMRPKELVRASLLCILKKRSNDWMIISADPLKVESHSVL